MSSVRRTSPMKQSSEVADSIVFQWKPLSNFGGQLEETTRIKTRNYFFRFPGRTAAYFHLESAFFNSQEKLFLALKHFLLTAELRNW